MSINLVSGDGKIKAKVTDNIEDDTIVVDGKVEKYTDAAAKKEQEVEDAKRNDDTQNIE